MHIDPVRLITLHKGASAALMARLGVTERTLREARANGYFAASWFPTVREVCDEFGLDCPMAAFNWKIAVRPSLGGINV